MYFIIVTALKNSNREIYVVSAQLSKMRDTVLKDTLKILNGIGAPYESSGILYGAPRIDFNNGSFIRFLGLDKEDVGKGLRSDIVYVNEANKIKSFDSIRELTSRAKRQIYDFNPNRKFWFHDEIQPLKECGFLITTFNDNEALPSQERKNILAYKEKGFDPQGNVINEYWANMWRIYGEGQIGSVPGRIFYWKPVSYRDFLQIEAPVIYTVDWGTADPFAIGCEKYKDGQIFTHELNYESENQWQARLSPTEVKQIKGRDGDGFVTWLFNRLQIPKHAPIVCDNNRHSKIISLRRAGWERAVAIRKPQGSIVDGIDLLQGLDVFYTETSKNIEYEQENYQWDTDRNGTPLEKPLDADNHHIDRIRYGAMYLRDKGIINRV